MITLTKEEAITMLKNLSQVDGALLALDNQFIVQSCLDYSVDVLTSKLLQEDKDEQHTRTITRNN